MKTLRTLAVLAIVGAAACGDSSSGSPDGPAGTPDAGCFTNPTTNDEIINACTTAVGIDKKPVLPLLNSDGSLPPLP